MWRRRSFASLTLQLDVSGFYQDTSGSGFRQEGSRRVHAFWSHQGSTSFLGDESQTRGCRSSPVERSLLFNGRFRLQAVAIHASMCRSMDGGHGLFAAKASELTTFQKDEGRLPYRWTGARRPLHRAGWSQGLTRAATPPLPPFTHLRLASLLRLPWIRCPDSLPLPP